MFVNKISTTNHLISVPLLTQIPVSHSCSHPITRSLLFQLPCKEVIRFYDWTQQLLCDVIGDMCLIVQWKSCVRQQISAPSVPNCICVKELFVKISGVFQVIKSPHSRCYYSRLYVRVLKQSPANSENKTHIKQPFKDIHENCGTDKVKLPQVKTYHTDLAVTSLCMAVNGSWPTYMPEHKAKIQ